MKRLLVVEDSKLLSNYLVQHIKAAIDIEIDVVDTFKSLKLLLQEDKTYTMALVDIHLPDMNDCELIDYVLERGIPSIVMTGDFQEQVYREISRKKIIDFVLKDSFESIDYIIKLTQRIIANINTKVMVLDDSTVTLKRTCGYLKSQLFDVVVEDNVLQALDRLKRDKEIKIVISDYYMPLVDGVDFLKQIRKKKNKNELGIIGMSSDAQSAIKFLKYGANDFINKPFMKEEFVHRVNNLTQNMENVAKLTELANKDYLSQVFNRKYFFEQGQKYFKNALKKEKNFAIAMIDIDNFKTINDTYGHAVGDMVIKHLAQTLQERTKGQDLVARFGGEEFCVLLKDIPSPDAYRFFTDLCEVLAQSTIPIDPQKEISYTVSIGVTTQKTENLDAMIKAADSHLYDAKNSGKNRCVTDEIALVS